jgi:hypothetical protein
MGATTPPESGFVPTCDVLNWRSVWPGEWTCDNAGYIWADSLKGGRTHMIDVRGWGYLTGRGMGALALDNVTASRLQDDLGALLCAAPDLLASCVEFLPILERQLASVNPGGIAGASVAVQTAKARVERMRTAVLKATTANSVGTKAREAGRSEQSTPPVKTGEG